MVSPKSIPIFFKFFRVMRVDLGIKLASAVLAVSTSTAKYQERNCGILYRS